MNSKVKKAVIPAAGLGTRFLPATKSIPKGIIPILDTPMIQYVVDEAVRAGAEEVLLITSEGDAILDDYFGAKPELEAELTRRGKPDLAKLVHGYADRCRIRRIVQAKPLGLGHAVLMAKDAVGNDPFFVLLADEIIYSEPASVAQLEKIYSQTGQSAVAVMEVPLPDVSRYGIVSGQPAPESWARTLPGKCLKIEKVVEKPAPESAPSRFALPGRYLFTSKLFSHLEKVKPGRGGEIQLTDGMEMLAADEGVYAYQIQGDRFDTGNPRGYLEATVAFALMREDLRADARKILQKYAGLGSSSNSGADS